MAEAKKKPKLPTLVTPKGVASFSYCQKPDTEGQYADNKYKITIGLDKGDPVVEALVKKLEAQHIEARGKKKTESPVKDGDEVYADIEDEDKKERQAWKQGKYILTFKSQFAPQVLNRAGEELEEGIVIMGGDIIKVAFAARPYEAGKNAGISLSLRAVKLIQKRAGGGADYSDAFGDDDDDSDMAEDDAPEGAGDGSNTDF